MFEVQCEDKKEEEEEEEGKEEGEEEGEEEELNYITELMFQIDRKRRRGRGEVSCLDDVFRTFVGFKARGWKKL